MKKNTSKKETVNIDFSIMKTSSQYQLSMQVLIDQINTMIDIKSNPNFDAKKWLESWLSKPLPALGGVKPASYLNTVEGQKHISNLLAIMQSGAYA